MVHPECQFGITQETHLWVCIWEYLLKRFNGGWPILNMGGTILWVGGPGWIRKGESKLCTSWLFISPLPDCGRTVIIHLMHLLHSLPWWTVPSHLSWSKPSFLKLAWEKYNKKWLLYSPSFPQAMASIAGGWLLAYFKHSIIIQNSVSSIPVPRAVASVSWCWTKFLLWNFCNLEYHSLMGFLETLPRFHRRAFIFARSLFCF